MGTRGATAFLQLPVRSLSSVTQCSYVLQLLLGSSRLLEVLKGPALIARRTPLWAASERTAGGVCASEEWPATCKAESLPSGSGQAS